MESCGEERACARRLLFRPQTPGQARQVTRQAVAEAGWRGDAEGAVLCASELVANAIKHTGEVTRFEVIVSPSGLRVEVDDEGAGEPAARPVSRATSSGRGLLIVEALAYRWGVLRHESGKTVWFEMRLPEAS